MSDDTKPEDSDKDTPETDEPEKDLSPEGEADTDGDGEPAAPATGLKAKLAGKGKIISIALAAVILIGGGAGAYVLGVFTSPKPHQATIELPGPPVYMELPRITVDIKPSPQRARPFIRLTVQVQLEGEPAKLALEEKQLAVMDALQSHLRTITAPELSGAEGTERLRVDFTDIINNIIAPERAITVLYKDILVR